MQGLSSTSALFWAPEKAGVRQPFLILSPFVWGPPRMQGLRSTSALLWAPEKAGVRQPLLILSLANNLTMTCTGGTGHALSSGLLNCGIGVWLGTSGVAAPISSPVSPYFVAFYAILHSQASLSPPPPPLWTMGACPASCLD